MKDVCLVVPTIRESNLNTFIERWNEIDLFSVVDLFVVEDNPKKTFDIDCIKNRVSAYYDWSAIDEELGKDAWIIPRRSDTIRSYGYLKAHQHKYKYIMTLNDDCYPPTEADGFIYDSGEAFVKEHLKYLEGKTRWYNTLNSVKPRGIPYKNIGRWNRNLINHGLCTNVLDHNAPTQLVDPKSEIFSFDNRIVPFGLYFPMCGMNVVWKGEATVLMYQLLMGCRVGDPVHGMEMFPFDRFGDTWCGVISKKICDLMGYTISTGMPYVRRERVSNPFIDLRKEAPGIEVNERFWEYIDFANCGQGNLCHSYYQMGEHVAMFDDFVEYKQHFVELGEAMKIWSQIIQEASNR